MSGRLGLTTPWARQYLPAEQRSAVVAEVPDGHSLGVSAYRRPGHWILWLNRELDEPGPDGRWVEQLWRVEMRDPDLQRACLRALRAHAPVTA